MAVKFIGCDNLEEAVDVYHRFRAGVGCSLVLKPKSHIFDLGKRVYNVWQTETQTIIQQT